MPINRVQFQPGLSIAEFMSQFGSEEQCEAALIAARWPEGFSCLACGGPTRQLRRDPFASRAGSCRPGSAAGRAGSAAGRAGSAAAGAATSSPATLQKVVGLLRQRREHGAPHDGVLRVAGAGDARAATVALLPRHERMLLADPARALADGAVGFHLRNQGNRRSRVPAPEPIRQGRAAVPD